MPSLISTGIRDTGPITSDASSLLGRGRVIEEATVPYNWEYGCGESSRRNHTLHNYRLPAAHCPDSKCSSVTHSSHHLHLEGDHGIGFVFACSSAEIEPKTIVAYGLTFGCQLALFAPFSNFAAPVAARWHCIAPMTELRKTYSEFAPSRPRSFRQCQFSGDAGPVLNDFSCG